MLLIEAWLAGELSTLAVGHRHTGVIINIGFCAMSRNLDCGVLCEYALVVRHLQI